MTRRMWAPAIAALALCFVGASDAFAGTTGTIRLDRDSSGTDAYSDVNAGEFAVTGFTGMSLSGLGVDVPINGSHFQTFCIERNEFVVMGRTYDWEINTAAVNGGAGGPNPDPISEETAYLYQLFWNGQLSNYEYTDLGDQAGERGDLAGELQTAIWFLENEITSVAAGSQAATWVAEAQAAVSSGAWSGIGNVRVLNLTSTNADGSINNHQDMLVVVPLPPAALAGFLLLGGMGVVSRIRRRRELLNS